MLGFCQKYYKLSIFSKELAWLKYYDQYFFVPDLSPMTTARKATPSEDPVECGGTFPLGKPVKMAVMSLQYSIEGGSSYTQELQMLLLFSMI